MTETDPAPGRVIVLYDGECALCQKSVRLLRRLDWRKRLAYHDARDVGHLPPTSVTLEPNRLLEEMHVLTADRTQALAGFQAIRRIAWLVPLLWPIAPLLYLPGVPRLGQRVYLWIAQNRFGLVPCAHGACTVPRRR